MVGWEQRCGANGNLRGEWGTGGSSKIIKSRGQYRKKLELEIVSSTEDDSEREDNYSWEDLYFCLDLKW